MKIFFAPLLALPLLIGGCSDRAENGFEPQTASLATTATSKVAVRIGSIRGMNSRSGRKLRKALAASLQRRGFTIVRGRRAGNTVELTGTLATLNEGRATAVTYEWRLRDGAGPVARPITGFERSAGGSSDPWKSMKGDMVTRMSERIAQKIAMALGRG